MKPICTGLVGAALLALTTVSAQADCAAEIARVTAGAGASEGISKDGSLAPLEEASDTNAGATADAAATGAAAASGMSPAAPATEAGAGAGEGIAKDGSHVPLETAGGAQPGVAMSGADAQAQQAGEPTAAEQAANNADAGQAADDAAAGQAADDGADLSAREAHVQAARDALAAGDEEACMMAIRAADAG